MLRLYSANFAEIFNHAFMRVASQLCKHKFKSLNLLDKSAKYPRLLHKVLYLLLKIIELLQTVSDYFLLITIKFQHEAEITQNLSFY